MKNIQKDTLIRNWLGINVNTGRNAGDPGHYTITIVSLKAILDVYIQQRLFQQYSKLLYAIPFCVFIHLAVDFLMYLKRDISEISFNSYAEHFKTLPWALFFLVTLAAYLWLKWRVYMLKDKRKKLTEQETVIVETFLEETKKLLAFAKDNPEFYADIVTENPGDYYAKKQAVIMLRSLIFKLNKTEAMRTKQMPLEKHNRVESEIGRLNYEIMQMHETFFAFGLVSEKNIGEFKRTHDIV